VSPAPEEEWWARWDNTKPGIAACGARSAWHGAVPVQIGLVEPPHLPSLLVELAFSPDATALGAPPSAWIRCGVPVVPTAPDHAGEAPLSDTDLEIEVLWLDKPATRLPEATWLAFVPAVAEPERWELDKLGQRVSPLDVVRHGGRSLHAVGEGMHYRGPDGRLTIATHHAPLVALGRPNLLDADPPLPDLAAGFHVLLHDNCWGTNFPMWNEGAARFHFRCSIG
jgi:hypothetical protein